MKFKTVLISELKEREEEEKRQSYLRKKYEVPEGKVVVEKNTTLKLIITTLGKIIRFIAQALLVIFAAIGLTGLLTPEIREDFYLVFLQWKEAILFLLQ